MHRICSIKLLLCVMLPLAFLSACGKPKQTEFYTLGEWFHLVKEEAGIQDVTSQAQNSSDDTDIQSLYAWHVIDSNLDFQKDQKLTKNWAAYTLVNLLDANEEGNEEIRDIATDLFEHEIRCAVHANLLRAENGKFHPNEVMTKEDAYVALEKTLLKMNGRTFEDHAEIDFKSDRNVYSIQPVSFDQNTLTITVTEGTYAPDDILTWMSDEGSVYYAVVSQQENEIRLREIDLETDIEHIDVQGSDDIDFSNAEISIPEEETGSTNAVSLLSFHPKQKTYRWNGFEIVLNTTGSSFRAEVTRTLPYGSKVFADLSVNSLHADYKWKSANQNDAYFKVRFQSTEHFGIKNTSYKQLYGDFSKIDKDHFLSSLKSCYQEKNDAVESTLEIATIRVPVPSSPLLTLTLKLDLTMKASGKIELQLRQSNEVGCEIKNGNFRVIRNLEKNAQANIQANASILAGIRVGISAASAQLSDLGLEVGANASITTRAYLYDDKGKMNEVGTDLPYDVVSEMGEGQNDILFCGDMNAYWVMNLRFNSTKTLLGKLGISENINLINAENASFIPEDKRHIENFHLMKTCTRKNRIRTSRDSIQVSKKIVLQKYSIVVKDGESKKIEVTGLPDGYGQSDLQYCSSDESIVQVMDDGTLVGKATGSASITVQTVDQKYSVQCNVIVPQRHI